MQLAKSGLNFWCQMTIKIPNAIDKTRRQRLRMRRMMLHMSQEKLGEAFGLTFQQVQKYEKGTNRTWAGPLLSSLA